MDLVKYFSPLFRWWWLMVLAILLSAGSSYAVVSRQPLSYEASTTLIFGQSFSSPNPNSGQIYLEQQMAAIYADLGNREVTWTRVQDALGMTWLPKYVVRALPNTALIEVTVTDTDPERARAVADEVARQLVLQTPKTAESNGEEQQAFIQDQVAKLQEQIKTTELDIARLKDELGGLTSARQIQDAETQITAMESKLTTLQTTYASLLSNTAGGALNTLTIIQPAATPTEPSGPSKWLLMGLSAVIGLVLAALGAYLIEYFDRSVKSVDEAQESTGIPVIGRLPHLTGKGKRNLHLLKDPFSPQTNAIRHLRTQLEILGVGRSLHAILVFSPGVSEGKSTVALNLASVFANTRKKVMLVDTDYHKSTISTALGVSHSSGLVDILSGRRKLEDTLLPVLDGKLQFLPSGRSVLETDDLLGSDTMTSLLEDMKNHAEVIIIDSPPFILADALDLAARVDGVVLVVRARQTQRPELLKMVDQLRRAEIPILGIVVNGVPLESYGYKHYYGHRSPDGNEKVSALPSAPQDSGQDAFDDASAADVAELPVRKRTPFRKKQRTHSGVG